MRNLHRSPRSQFALVVAACACVVAVAPVGWAAASGDAVTSSTAPLRAEVQQSSSSATFTVRGNVARPRFYTVGQLRKAFAAQTVKATYASGSAKETHTFSGPLLYDVATAARPRFDATVKNDALAFAVAVTAKDGYRAVVSWGELDPGFGAQKILLATHQDGAPLDRPRLVVPGDAKGGRYVSDVRNVAIRDLGR
ncbi:hypothetical protein [Demetria terragena]|uniref:hypothetical protein n=1 Tax=Demetria terragena TaxID=63959 RepID=UPI0003622F18|nr:hypothetical protein [Demetria terragena]